MTVGFGIISIFILPNYPHNTWWISGEERAIAVWRLIEDAGETEGSGSDEVGVLQGLVEALRDYKVWMIVWIHICLTVGAGIVVFYPSVVKTLGFRRGETTIPHLCWLDLRNMLTPLYRGHIRPHCAAVYARVRHECLWMPSRRQDEGKILAHDRLAFGNPGWPYHLVKYAQYRRKIFRPLPGHLLSIYSI